LNILALRGNDTYLMYCGMYRDTINDFDYTPGTSDSMTIGSWDFWSKGSSWENAQHVEQFRLADGKVLMDSQVNQLIQAMAAFAPPSAGQTILPQDYQKTLAPVLAANWR
jgi:hypothetical protein